MSQGLQLDFIAADFDIDLERWDAMPDAIRARYITMSRVRSIQSAHERYVREKQQTSNSNNKQ